MKMGRMIVAVAVMAGLGACADQKPLGPPSARFGPPNTFHGMAPNTGLDGFKPDNGKYQPDESAKFKGFKGF
jgi:hypothetical protein